jgi:hypothetical protein
MNRAGLAHLPHVRGLDQEYRGHTIVDDLPLLLTTSSGRGTVLEGTPLWPEPPSEKIHHGGVMAAHSE